MSSSRRPQYQEVSSGAAAEVLPGIQEVESEEISSANDSVTETSFNPCSYKMSNEDSAPFQVKYHIIINDVGILCSYYDCPKTITIRYFFYCCVNKIQ